MINPDKNLELNLTAAECNVILMGLHEVPFKLAAPLIEKIRSQIIIIDPTAFDRGDPTAVPAA